MVVRPGVIESHALGRLPALARDVPPGVGEDQDAESHRADSNPSQGVRELLAVSLDGMLESTVVTRRLARLVLGSMLVAAGGCGATAPPAVVVGSYGAPDSYVPTVWLSPGR